jgi:signal transduction histidine kinase
MNPSLAQFILLLLFGAFHLPVIFFVLQRRYEGHTATVWLVVLYSVLAMVANTAQAAWQNPEDAFALQELQMYTALTLAALLMIMLQVFLKSGAWRLWAGFWALWVIGLSLVLVNALDLPEMVWTNGELALYRSRLGPAWAILGWLILTIGFILTLANANRITRQTLFRNRLNYWWAPIFFTLVNDILLFSGTPIAGQPFRWLAAVTAAYVAGTHHVPDLRNILRRALIYIAVIVTVVGLYVAGFLLLQALFGRGGNFSPLAAGALVALLLAVVFAPLSGLIARAITAWLHGDQYDASLALHRYSESISNILDMDRLANIAVGIILETMHVERGYLFLVDTERQTDGRRLYKLRSAQTPEERQVVVAEVEEKGVLASYFTREQRPLLQYDLDLLSAFRKASPSELTWFRKLNAEVYVPILAKKQWIGLFAFGSKTNGNRYTREDLAALSSHASQTAVALENARLVDNLVRLNTELRQARRALEKNNQELQRIDQAKSDFISIASHELRTPLTVIKGYTEMLMEDGGISTNARKMMNGIHDGALRLHEVMDSMFDIAQLDARTLEPHLQPVELGGLLREVCAEQADVILQRKQTLDLDLPSLPLVKADPNLLKKLFHHITRNAVKFTPNNGRISISGRHIPSIVNLPNGGVEIVVSDTGVGVDPTLRDLIFTKFYQPGEPGKHSTSKTRFKGGGAGLGLALCKGIVEAHGGRIWVESPGYDEVNFPGSQFHVILPLGAGGNEAEAPMGGEVKFEIGSAKEPKP